MPLDTAKLAYGAPSPSSTSSQRTTSDEIAARFSSQITGKIFLITGVSPGGIGAALASSLASQSPSLLILAGRDSSKISATASSIQALNPSLKVRELHMDLSSLSSVTKACVEGLADVDKIDVVINNAGIMASPFSLTVDGVELQFAVNYLAHFHLTRLLLPKLRAACGGGRVVNVSSNGHNLGGIRWEDVNFANGEVYEKWEAYGQSKTANILHALALVTRGEVPTAVAVHPGVVGTNLVKDNARKDIEELIESANITLQTPEQGASTILLAALDPELKGFAYLQDCQHAKSAPHASNPKDAERLWRLSEKMIQAKGA